MSRAVQKPDIRSTTIAILLISLIGIAGGCSPAPSAPPAASSEANKPVLILTTSWPLHVMATAVVGTADADGTAGGRGSDIQVESAIAGGTVSRFWAPTADEVLRMQSARLILLQGAGYEPWTDRVSLPRSRMNDTAAGYYDQFIRIPDAVTHQHGPDGAHSHPGTVWATWLDPELAMSQLRAVSSACQKLRPELGSRFEANSARMAAELQTINAATESLAQKTAPENLTVLSDGPYYHYLVRRLGWKLTYLHWPENDTVLSDADRAELKEKAASSGSRLFLMAAGRSADQAELVESAGLKVVRIDCCEQSHENSSSLTARLKANIERLTAAFQP